MSPVTSLPCHLRPHSIVSWTRRHLEINTSSQSRDLTDESRDLTDWSRDLTDGSTQSDFTSLVYWPVLNIETQIFTPYLVKNFRNNFFFFYRHHLVIPSPPLTEEVATSAGVDAPVPRALLIGRLPLAPVGDWRDAGERLGRHRVGTEVTDLQLLEVLHEVLERHPATQTGRRVEGVASTPPPQGSYTADIMELKAFISEAFSRKNSRLFFAIKNKNITVVTGLYHGRHMMRYLHVATFTCVIFMHFYAIYIYVFWHIIDAVIMYTNINLKKIQGFSRLI